MSDGELGQGVEDTSGEAMTNKPGKFGITFDSQISLGNILTIATIVLGGIVGYVRLDSKVSAHVSDTQIHQPIEAKQKMIQDQFQLLIAPTNVKLDEISRRLVVIEGKIDGGK